MGYVDREVMSERFSRKWSRGGGSIFSRMTGFFRSKQSLSEQILTVTFRINSLKTRLEQESYRLLQRDRDLFEKCVQALTSRDDLRAKIYANEVAELRKITGLILRSQLALEQVSLRLETIRDFGNLASVIAPVTRVVGVLRSQLSGFMPQIGSELGEISENLQTMINEAGITVQSGFEVEASNEAQKILGEAAIVAEQKMKEKLPEIPVQIQALREKVQLR
jgi:division protein CdvB (Snf7/Vps24/ESCRT-III family)